jgi:GNAT superfamily N-acetyltransferase
LPADLDSSHPGIYFKSVNVARTKNQTKPKPIRIRAGTARDVGVIAKLIRDLAKYERLAKECHVSPKRLLRHGFGRRRYFETLIATRAGQPVGFALYFFTYSTFAASPTLYLEDLFVPAKERSEGIGRALLEALARVAVRRGCARMEWAVLDWNAPAIAFYHKLGAKLRMQWVPTSLVGAPLRRLAGYR